MAFETVRAYVQLASGLGEVTRERASAAAQELLATRDSITVIALRCGFSDSNYFKDVFKKKFGVTPREYRKSR